MTKNIRIPVVAFLLLCCNLISYAQETEHAKLDRYLRLLGDKNKFMGSVSVFSKGTEIYARSVGFADIDKHIVADAQSEYHIGSISKLFTTVMIFQAIEAGQLSLSSPIDSYFPIIKNAHKITIGHLLSHRSGIHNFTADEQYLNWNTQAKTKEQMVEIIARGGSDFEPDSKAQYSNSNFVLLSYILESLYKKPYAEILADRITRPLSLVNTHLGRKTISPEQNECNSYKYFDKWRIESVTHPSIPLGAGGIVSTPRDLNKFADALFKGKLISANSLSTMLALKDNFGMGIFPVPFYAKRGFGHSGGTILRHHLQCTQLYIQRYPHCSFKRYLRYALRSSEFRGHYTQTRRPGKIHRCLFKQPTSDQTHRPHKKQCLGRTGYRPGCIPARSNFRTYIQIHPRGDCDGI